MVKITILKKPAAAPYKRPAANPEPEEPMSLEEKMELFQRSKTQDLNSFRGTLTRNQREALWKQFERARGFTKDPKWRKFGILSAKAKTVTNTRSSF